VGAYCPAILLLVVLALACMWTGIPIAKLTRDPTAITGSHPFTGLLSNVGVLCWCATAAVCLFSHAFMRHASADGRVSGFLLYFGLITFVLLVDDLFQLHDYILSRHLHLNEKIVFSVYGLAILAGFVRFRDVVKESEAGLLALSLSFFALSIVADFFLESVLPWRHLFEDGTKFLGIVGWLGYFVSVGFRGVLSAAGRQEGAD